MNLSTRASIHLIGAAGLALLPDIRSDDPSRFSITGTLWEFDDVRITELTLSALTAVPTPLSKLQRLASLQTSVVFVLDGVLRTNTTDGYVFFVAGTAAVSLTGHLPAVTSRPGTRVLIVTTSHRPTLALDAGDTGDLLAISASAVRNEPALAFVEALIHTVRTHSVTTHPTAEIVTKLINSLIAADRPTCVFLKPDNIRQIRLIIAKNYTDSSFGPRTLARQLGIRVRDLDAVTGTHTLNEYAADLIGRYRLVRAMTLLQPLSQLSVTAVAEESGYRSAEELGTAMMIVYGITASALLSSQQHPTTTPTRDDGRPQHRHPSNPLATP